MQICVVYDSPIHTVSQHGIPRVHRICAVHTVWSQPENHKQLVSLSLDNIFVLYVSISSPGMGLCILSQYCTCFVSLMGIQGTNPQRVSTQIIIEIKQLYSG